MQLVVAEATLWVTYEFAQFKVTLKINDRHRRETAPYKLKGYVGVLT